MHCDTHLQTMIQPPYKRSKVLLPAFCKPSTSLPKDRKRAKTMNQHLQVCPTDIVTAVSISPCMYCANTTRQYCNAQMEVQSI